MWLFVLEIQAIGESLMLILLTIICLESFHLSHKGGSARRGGAADTVRHKVNLLSRKYITAQRKTKRDGGGPERYNTKECDCLTMSKPVTGC